MKKIKLNMWRDPAPRPPNYLSPHCRHGDCGHCLELRQEKKDAATKALQAIADSIPGMFWDTKTGGHQEQLGPSAPDHWLKSYVRSPHASENIG